MYGLWYQVSPIIFEVLDIPEQNNYPQTPQSRSFTISNFLAVIHLVTCHDRCIRRFATVTRQTSPQKPSISKKPYLIQVSRRLSLSADQNSLCDQDIPLDVDAGQLSTLVILRYPKDYRRILGRVGNRLCSGRAPDECSQDYASSTENITRYPNILSYTPYIYIKYSVLSRSTFFDGRGA